MDTLIRLFIICAAILLFATIVNFGDDEPKPVKQPTPHTRVVDLCKAFELQSNDVCQKEAK